MRSSDRSIRSPTGTLRGWIGPAAARQLRSLLRRSRAQVERAVALLPRAVRRAPAGRVHTSMPASPGPSTALHARAAAGWPWSPQERPIAARARAARRSRPSPFGTHVDRVRHARWPPEPQAGADRRGAAASRRRAPTCTMIGDRHLDIDGRTPSRHARDRRAAGDSATTAELQADASRARRSGLRRSPEPAGAGWHRSPASPGACRRRAW